MLYAFFSFFLTSLITFLFGSQTVLDITKKWINQFVIKYNLCPFAQPVVKANQVRYRVILEEDPEKILERIKLEVISPHFQFYSNSYSFN